MLYRNAGKNRYIHKHTYLHVYICMCVCIGTCNACLLKAFKLPFFLDGSRNYCEEKRKISKLIRICYT